MEKPTPSPKHGQRHNPAVTESLRRLAVRTASLERDLGLASNILSLSPLRILVLMAVEIAIDTWRLAERQKSYVLWPARS